MLGGSQSGRATLINMSKNFWLMKSEPYVYSIDDMEQDGQTFWEGVRNYAARNHMRAMRVGDEGLFYHSNAKPPGVAGVVRIVCEAYPDHFAFHVGHKYFDAKSDPEKPRWDMVDVEFVAKFPVMVGLPLIKETLQLAEMVLLRQGRLSVQPVTEAEFEIICRLGEGV